MKTYTSCPADRSPTTPRIRAGEHLIHLLCHIPTALTEISFITWGNMRPIISIGYQKKMRYPEW